MITLYPTVAAIFDSNRPAVYTIAIYRRLYTTEWRHRSTFLKCKWPPFFPSIQKFGWWISLFGCINVASNNCCVITFALFVKYRNNFIPVWVICLIVCFPRWLFRSIYIAKTKVTLSQFELYNKIKILFAVLFLPFHLFRHFKTDTGNYTFAHCSYPNVPLLFACPSMNVCGSLTVYSLSVNDVMGTTFFKL